MDRAYKFHIETSLKSPGNPGECPPAIVFSPHLGEGRCSKFSGQSDRGADGGLAEADQVRRWKVGRRRCRGIVNEELGSAAEAGRMSGTRERRPRRRIRRRRRDDEKNSALISGSFLSPPHTTAASITTETSVLPISGPRFSPGGLGNAPSGIFS